MSLAEQSTEKRAQAEPATPRRSRRSERFAGSLIAASALGMILLSGCGRESNFDIEEPAQGPGSLVGREKPIVEEFRGSVGQTPVPREVTDPDWQSCDVECVAYCQQQFDNPIDEAICPSLWGAGLSSRPVDKHEACRRLYADLEGEFPTLRRVEEDCLEHDLSSVAQRLIKSEKFVEQNQIRWADTLRYNNVALNLERIYDADELVGKLYRGEVRFDEFVEVVSAHPVLTRRFDDPGDRVAGLFELFVGRPPYDNERADMAKLYTLWQSGYYNHAALGLRLPDSTIEHRCVGEDGDYDEQTAGACTSVLWGFNRVILRPDFRSMDNRTWAGNLTEEEWKLLQTPGRIIGAWPEVWEKAASDVLNLYLGYDIVQYVPGVVQKLVEHILAHGGDIRAAHHAVVTSNLYLQSTKCDDAECDPSEVDPPPWTYGPLRQADAELWVNSLRALTEQEPRRCDHRLSMPGDLLRSTPAAMGLVLDSYWTLDDQMRLENSYPDLVKTLGGCPDNEVSGRFKTISILNTATQEGYASEVCDPTMTGEGAVSVEVLLPGSVSAADELTEKVAVSTFEHQVGLFFGRPTTDDERDLAKTASSSCVPKPCSAETYARTVCFALLSSSEMLFY